MVQKMPERATVQDKTIAKAAQLAGVTAVNDELSRRRTKRAQYAERVASRPSSGEVLHVAVNPELWAAAKAIVRSKDNSYSDIEILSETEVRLV